MTVTRAGCASRECVCALSCGCVLLMPPVGDYAGCCVQMLGCVCWQPLAQDSCAVSALSDCAVLEWRVDFVGIVLLRCCVPLSPQLACRLRSRLITARQVTVCRMWRWYWTSWGGAGRIGRVVRVAHTVKVWVQPWCGWLAAFALRFCAEVLFAAAHTQPCLQLHASTLAVCAGNAARLC